MNAEETEAAKELFEAKRYYQEAESAEYKDGFQCSRRRVSGIC